MSTFNQTFEEFEFERNDLTPYIDKYIKENGTNPISYMTKGQYKKWLLTQPKPLYHQKSKSRPRK